MSTTEKIITLEQAARLAAELKATGKTVVTINGSFDLLHAGHADILEQARAQGDTLFVGVNSDRSVQEGKGAARPFVSEQHRAQLLAALQSVDYVIILDESYDALPEKLLTALRPQVHVNGGDYGPPEQWREWPAMQAVGAKGYAVARRVEISSSDIVRNIQAAPSL